MSVWPGSWRGIAVRVPVVAAALLLGWGSPARAVDLAVDTGPGPLAIASAEYRLPAAVDPSVARKVATELWARVYRPAELSRPPYPVLVFLHGNHDTCGYLDRDLGMRFDDDSTYTDTGRCPPGYVVVPSHGGFGYVARRLAAWGFVVVSINANRGINVADGVAGDESLDLRRGRLVLRHLVVLPQPDGPWNTTNSPRAISRLIGRSTSIGMPVGPAKRLVTD
jgi:hypothetical protein